MATDLSQLKTLRGNAIKGLLADKKMPTSDLAKKIADAPRNKKSVTKCATRLRNYMAGRNLAPMKVCEQVAGVFGVQPSNVYGSMTDQEQKKAPTVPKETKPQKRRGRPKSAEGPKKAADSLSVDTFEVLVSCPGLSMRTKGTAQLRIKGDDAVLVTEIIVPAKKLAELYVQSLLKKS